MTMGVSDMMAKEMTSCMREKPGLDVAVMALAPAHEAPRSTPAEAISSSIWMKRPPTRGRRRAACSMISEAGVMGYPA
jgi:hypothetical protein